MIQYEIRKVIIQFKTRIVITLTLLIFVINILGFQPVFKKYVSQKNKISYNQQNCVFSHHVFQEKLVKANFTEILKEFV
jgi:hypothetical protein